MRITKLIARNIAPIFVSMGKREIVLDLSKQKNRTILLVGDNGSGKSTILSMLNPWAFAGSFDIRGGQSFILEGQDGYKEIHYTHGQDYYVIKHHYMYGTGKGIKSFIYKNDQDLNPNGNVTSFKEITTMELGIEQDMMRLLRLGDNTTGFISMGQTGRKKFMSDMLSEINIYLALHKKVTDDSRAIKSLLRSVSEKMNKLHVFNKEEEYKTRDELRASLQDLRVRLGGLRSEEGRLNGLLESIFPQGVDVYLRDSRALEQEVSELMSGLKRLDNDLKKRPSVILGTVEDEQETVRQQIQEINSRRLVITTKLDMYLTRLNSLYKQKEEKETQYSLVTSSEEYDRLKLYYEELNSKKMAGDKQFKGFIPSCTKEDILRVLSIFQELDRIAQTIYEFSSASVQEVVDLIRRKQSVDRIARDEVVKIDRKISSLLADSGRMQTHLANEDKVYVLYKANDDCECPYRQFYQDSKNVENKDERIRKNNEEIKSLENKRERFASYQEIARKVDYILMALHTNSDLTEKIPGNMFNAVRILEALEQTQSLYNESTLSSYMNVLEEHDAYLNLIAQIEDTRRELSFMEKSNDSIGSAQEDLRRVDAEIEEAEYEMAELRAEQHRLQKQLDVNEKIQTNLEIVQLASQRRAGLVENIERLSEQVKQRQAIVEQSQAYLNLKVDVARQAREVQQEIDAAEQRARNIEYRMQQFDSLTEEKETLNKDFDNVQTIQESLSGNKGIPLLFMQTYMADSRALVNELLDSVYKGSLFINKFIINDKEFSIPYTKKGIVVEDAIHCSQGEKSFMSLAISFAFIQKSFPHYNIMIFDEVDGPLDKSYSADFLNIVDRHMAMLQAEQLFVVSHKDMFDRYPVDVILTSNQSIENYENVNILQRLYAA